MNWQVNYALNYIQETHKTASVLHIRDDAISIKIPSQPDVIAAITAADTIDAGLATQYHEDFPDMDFLCGYRKDCVWEGEAIRYVESNRIGWGNAGTLDSALRSGEVKTAAHKNYSFSYRLVKQSKSVSNLDREFDRVFTMALNDGRSFRVGMIMQYEPTADAIRTFWDTFGPIDIAWNIHPNGNFTQSAIEAGRSLECNVMKWSELKALMQNR